MAANCREQVRRIRQISGRHLNAPRNPRPTSAKRPRDSQRAVIVFVATPPDLIEERDQHPATKKRGQEIVG